MSRASGKIWILVPDWSTQHKRSEFLIKCHVRSALWTLTLMRKNFVKLYRVVKSMYSSRRATLISMSLLWSVLNSLPLKIWVARVVDLQQVLSEAARIKRPDSNYSPARIGSDTSAAAGGGCTSQAVFRVKARWRTKLIIAVFAMSICRDHQWMVLDHNLLLLLKNTRGIL